MSLTLAQASDIAAGTLAAARTNNAKPMAVVVLDAGGHPITLSREDGASFFRHEIAHAKAYGALGMGADTRAVAQRAKNNPVFFSSVTVTVGGNLPLSPGGVLVRDNNGNIIGAVGVSGDTGDMDEQCAQSGIEAADLAHGSQA
ncbi:GlcG/HbpS family heme-binding protein [Halioxenophilus aromaticivorans]|uniref:Heme-binding protein n=1 Tax=Halioxenophilus aromaticivorans TaxID=1306992 RepID=A0AAV3U3H6_9ALTE